MVFCPAKLGLRAGEVARLVLKDLDWHRGILRLTQTKGRRERLLPLSPEVGQALAHYLRHGRPATTQRQVFVTLPGGAALSSLAISQLTVRALERAHLVFPRPGAHLLRRTFATHLIQKGVGCKAIADLPGHRQLNTTQVYAQVSWPMLQAVAQPWPEVSR